MKFYQYTVGKMDSESKAIAIANDKQQLFETMYAPKCAMYIL